MINNKSLIRLFVKYSKIIFIYLVLLSVHICSLDGFSKHLNDYSSLLIPYLWSIIYTTVVSVVFCKITIKMLGKQIRPIYVLLYNILFIATFLMLYIEILIVE